MNLKIAKKLEKDVAKAKDVQIYIYPEQGHAFLNDDDWSIEKRKELGFVGKDVEPVSAEQAVRDQAWGRIYDYFIKHLKA